MPPPRFRRRGHSPHGGADDQATGGRHRSPAWHQRSITEAVESLGSARAGLSADEAAQRLARYGANLLEQAPPRGLLMMFAAQFADFMILVLLAAAAISGVLGDVTDTVVIGAIVVLNALLGLVQEARAERAMAALKQMAAPSAIALREGRPLTVAASDLVPGDVVVLEAGGIVPADLRLTEIAGLRVNESALTGESVPVDKSSEPIDEADTAIGDRRNMAYKGTIVTYGRGAGLVVATGMRTELGRIARLLTETHATQTPLQRRLGTFGRRLAVLVLVICAIVFVAGLLRGEPVLPMFLTALSLAVAAIPEAMPAVVSVSLALGARKMAAHHTLIRHLPAVESLGAVTFICSDKTGTLTTNEMRVEQYYCDGAPSSTVGTSPPWQRLLHAMAVSHDAYVDAAGRINGDPTEAALLRAARAAGFDRRDGEARTPRVAEVPFDSSRKCMTTVHRDADGTFLSITKGAAEIIINRSVREQRGSGLEPIRREKLLRIADAMASDGLRVLAIGARRWQALPEATASALENDLEFLALVGLLDPPRPEARDAIHVCSAAGIVPVMITGDHPATARAIAERLGMLPKEGGVLTGAELAALPMEEFTRRVRDVRVYARVAPEQKVEIVTALQANGEIVAMTGDGVNDAPALQRADVGISMGVTGTDVAKEASDMVLLDDDFATIVGAVREGRRIYDNLRRFVRYVLTTNSGEIWTIFLAPFLGLPVPLLPIQILWINLVTDSLPGLALASEAAERDVMRRSPRPPSESLFAHGLGIHALLVGLLMAGLVLAVQAWHVRAGSPAWQTAALTTLCFTQLAHVLAIRSERVSLFTLGLLSNRPLLAAVILTVGLQLAIVYVPALRSVFKTVPLSGADLALCAGCAAVVLAAVEIEKWVHRLAAGSPRAV